MLLNHQKTISWHSKFVTKQLAEDVFLLANNHSFILPNKEYANVIDCIEKRVTITDYCQEMSMNEKISFFQLIDNLSLNHIIAQESEHHHTTDTLMMLSRNNIEEDYVLKNVLFNETNHTIYKNILAEHDITLLVIAHYSEPVFSQLVAVNKPMLIINVSGSRSEIGPLITPSDFCLTCLKSSFNRNKPLKTWLEKELNESINFPYQVAAFEPNLFKAAVETILGSLNTNLYFRYDGDTQQIDRKYLHKFTHCKKCSSNISSTAKIELKPTAKDKNQENGYRHISAKETYENIKHYVDKESGIVTSCRKLEVDLALPYQVYKSSFYCNIQSEQDIIHKRFELTTLGKGRTNIQAKVSAICEAFERYSAYFQGNESFVYETFDQIKETAYPPQKLAPYSQKQMQKARSIDYANKSSSTGELLFTESTKVHWVPAWSFTNEKQVYLPNSFLFAQAPETIKYCNWDSNGCAAGNTIEEAILQGFLELVERDAVAIWWYNKLTLPAVSKSILKDKITIDATIGTSWDYWLLDATNDIEIPVYIALAKSKVTEEIMFGFGSHLAPALAAERAVTELVQLMSVKDAHSAPFNFKDIVDEAYLYPDNSQGEKLEHDFHTPKHLNLKEDVEYCIEKAKSAGFDFIVYNYDRQECPVEAVKVIVPGFCHIWPQLGNERLYKLPVQLKRLKSEKDENTINQQALYV